jgi:hypothetical protein
MMTAMQWIRSYAVQYQLAQAEANRTGENHYLVKDSMGRWFAINRAEANSRKWDQELIRQSRTVWPQKAR